MRERLPVSGINAYFFVTERYANGEVWAAWQWCPLRGVFVTVGVGGQLSMRHERILGTRE